MAIPYIIAFCAIVVATAGQILLKLGISQYQDHHGVVEYSVKSIFDLSLSPTVMLGLFCYFSSAGLWIATLTRLELSQAYPLLGLSYVLVLLASYFLLGESVSMYRILGTVLIIFGVVIIGVTK
jgi:drug/metabolite transporter (DMT)-like permease